MIEDFEADFAKYEQPKKDKSKPSDGSDFDADFAKYETASIGSKSDTEEAAPPAPAVGARGKTPVGSMAWEVEKRMGKDRSKQSFERAASEVVKEWNTPPKPEPEIEDYSKGYKVELSPEELGYFDRRKNATLAGLQIAKNKAKTILGAIPAAIVSPGAPGQIAMSGADLALGTIKSIVAPGTPGIESKYVNEDFNKVREVDLPDGTKQQVRFGDNAIRMQGPQGLRFYHKDPDGVLRVAKPVLSPEDTIQMRKEKATSREDRIKRAASRILKKQEAGADAGVIGRIDYSVNRMFDELGAGITEQVADLLPDSLKLSTLAKVSPALALAIRNSGIKSDATVKDLADFARENQEAYMRASNEMADDYAAEGKYIQAFVARNLQNTGSQVAAQSSLLAASALTGTVAGASARVLGASERGARVVAAVASSLPEGYQEGQGVKREVFQSFKDKGYSDAGAMAYAQDAADKTLATNVLLQAPGNIIGLGVEGKILKKINEGEKAAVKALAKKSVLKSAVKSTYEYGKDLFYQTGEEGLQKAISMGAGETAGGVGSDFALTAVRSVFTKEALDEALSALPVVALMGGGSALVESRNKRAEAKAAKESEALSDIGKAEELLKAKIGEATAKTAPEAVSEPVSPDPEMQAYEQEMSAVVAQTGQSLDAVAEEVANSRPEVADIIKTNAEAVKAKLVQEGNVENFSKYAAVALNPVVQYGPVGVEFARVASNANVFNNAASVLSALPPASIQTVNELVQAKQKEVDTAIAEHKVALDAVEASKAAENDLGTVAKLTKVANDKASAVKAKAKKASVEIEAKVKPIVVEAKAKVESDLKAASKEIVEPMAVAPTADSQKFIVGSRVSKDRNWTNASLQEVRQEVRRPIEEFESSRKGVYPDFMTPQEVSDLERNISYQLGNIAEREIGYNLMEDSKATPGTTRHDRVMEDLKRDMQKLKELDKKYEQSSNKFLEKEEPAVKEKQTVSTNKPPTSASISGINPSDDIDSIVYKLDLSMPWLTDDEMAKEISRLTGQQVNVSSLPKRKIASPGHMTSEEAQDYLANKRPDGVTADDFIEELSKIVESKASIVALRKAGLLNTVVSQADANKLGIGKNTLAVVRTENGKKAVYFVLHRINNVKKIIPLFMHEIGVHVGLKGFMGDKYRDLLKMVADAVVKGDAQLKYAFDMVQKGYGEKESYQKFSTMDAMAIFNEGSEASERFLEEVIAQVVNTMEFEKSFTGYMKEISKRIIASIKAWLSGRGFNVKAITRDHLNYIVKGSFDAVVREAESFAKAQQQTFAQESEEVVSEKISFVVAGKKVTAEIKGKDAIEAFNTAQALNTVLQAEATGNPEKHKMVADMFSQFKKDLAEDNIKSRPFPIPLAEMLFGDKSAWFTMTGADYIETMKANNLLLGTESATKERLIGIGLSKTDAQTAAKEARRFHTYAEFVPESDKVKQKKAEAIVDAVSEEELPSLSVDKNSPLWSVLEESSTVRRPEGYSSVTLEFATRAFLALTGGKKFQNLAATLRSYSSAINEAKMKLNPYLETMGKAVKSERDNQILGWLLGFSTVQNKNKGIKLPEEWIRLAFPGISDALIGAYNAGWMFGQVAKTEQIDAARILNNNLKKKVLASNVSIESKAKAIEKLDASLKEMVDNYNSKDFYWPLSRFGKYMYRFRDKEGNVVANFIVEEEGKKGDMELRKQIVEACQADSNFKKLYDNNEYVQDKSPVVLADIDDLSGNTAMSVDNVMLDYFTAARRAVEDNADALDALKLDVMSAKFEHFAKKHEVHRRGVPGWSTDALKVASVYAHGVSSTVANSTMAVELDNVLEQFSQQKLGSQYDPKNFNTARDMIDNAKNPPFRPSLNKLLGGGFLLHIGGRPSFFIAQMMQQLQSILPTMDRYYGGVSTAIAMAKAEKIAYSLTGIKKLDRFETIGIDELEDLLNSKIDWKEFRGLMKSEEKAKACADMVKAVLSRSIRQGSLQAQPSFGYTENVIKKFTDKLVGAAGVFALKGEQINRIVALTTWTILNMAEGEVQFTDESGYTKDDNNEAIFKELQDKAQEIEMSDVFERIYQTAENINELTNYVRGRGNQPGYMRHTGFKGSVIAAATNYKSFGLLNIMQFHAMGLIEAKRKRGKVAKVLAYARPQIVNAGIMALLAGPQSYVFFKLLDALIPDEFLLPIYDSIATKLKAYIREYFAMAGTDPKTANQWTNRIYYSLTNGAPNLTGADISGMLRNDLIDTKGNGAEIFAHNIAGATGSNLMDAYTSYSEKGIAAASKKMMPSLARGPIEAIEGKTSVGAGKTKLSAFERSLRAFSLQPTRIGYLRGESEMQFRFYGNVKKDLESELKDRAKRSAQSNDGKIEASVSKSIYNDVAQFNKDWKDFIVNHGQQRIDASKIISGVRYQRKATKKLFRITKEEEVK